MGITFTFEEIREVCRRLGLSVRRSGRKNYTIEGIDPDGVYRRTAVHWKAGGRNLAKGTADRIAKDLGFRNAGDMRDFLRDRKRRR